MNILVGCEKGGTGKSTIAVNLATILAQRGRDVLILDTDSQATSSMWSATRSEHENVNRIGCLQKYGPSIISEVYDLADRYDDIIMDSGGKERIELSSCMVVADIAIIPMAPSQFDLYTLSAMNRMVEVAKINNKDIIAKVLWSRCPTHPKSVALSTARKTLVDFKHLGEFKNTIQEREAFRKASTLGLGVAETNLDARATHELMAFVEEFYHE